MTPHEVKLPLDRKLPELAGGGPVPTIVGVHSGVLVDGTTVSVIYDIEPDVSGSGLHLNLNCQRWSAGAIFAVSVSGSPRRATAERYISASF
jgi:hypothetical protein